MNWLWLACISPLLIVLVLALVGLVVPTVKGERWLGRQR